jgi:Tfp pilus assembly protein FimT
VQNIPGLSTILQSGGELRFSFDHILAAIIAATALIVATVLQGWFFAVRLEVLKHKLAEQIESARSASLRGIEENSKRLQEMLALRNKRRAQLDQLLNAGSIAKSGARELVATSRFEPTHPRDKRDARKRRHVLSNVFVPFTRNSLLWCDLHDAR